MFELKDVSKYYHNDGVTNKGLIHIDLKLERNEIVVITGESGSGKSTLLNVITKQDSFDEGEIYYLGNETSYFSVDDMDYFRKNKIGFIFQNYNIIDSYTVLENVMLPLIINDVPYNEAKAEAMEIIRKVGLEKWANNRGTKLSGGQKQRCVIARALASRCEVLACDEPTGNLDSETGKEIVELIKEVAADKLVLIVTHNYEQFRDIATRKITVHDGEIIEDTYIEKKEKDAHSELDLDYVPVKRKVDLRIALNNLKSTPKKTLLMALITLFTAFFSLTLYQSIMHDRSSLYKENTFIYQGDNKIIAYKKDHSKLDATKLDSSGYKYEINQFGATTPLTMLYKTNRHGDYIYESSGVVYEPHASSYTVTNSKSNPSDLGVILIIPSNDDFYSKTKYKDALSSEFMLYSTSQTTIGISAVAKSSKVKEPVLTSENGYWNSYFRACEYFQNYPFDIKLDLESNTKLLLNDIGEEFENVNYFSNTVIDMQTTAAKPIPRVSTTGTNTLVVGKDFRDYETVYEASIYGDESKTKSFVKNKLNAKVIDVSAFDSSTALDRFLNNLLTYVSIAANTVEILVVYLIASVILLKVFSSKLECYAIFRTLGVTKRDMRKVLKFEVYSVVMAMTFLVLIIAFCIRFIPLDNAFVKLYRHMSFEGIIFYIIIMILISHLLAKKFNKKLFKNSVRETLKEEK